MASCLSRCHILALAMCAPFIFHGARAVVYSSRPVVDVVDYNLYLVTMLVTIYCTVQLYMYTVSNIQLTCRNMGQYHLANTAYRDRVPEYAREALDFLAYVCV